MLIIIVNMRMIKIPLIYKYNRKEKAVIKSYLKYEYDKTIKASDRLKKTNHERLMQIIRMHSLIRMGKYDLAIKMVGDFYPYVRRDEVDEEILIVFSELYDCIGFDCLSRRYEMLYMSLQKDINNEENKHNFIYDNDNFENNIDFFISHNQLLELYLVYLYYVENGIIPDNEFRHFIDTNYRFKEVANKINRLICSIDRVVILDDDNRYLFYSRLINEINSKIRVLSLNKRDICNLNVNNETTVVIGKTKSFIELMNDLNARKYFEVFYESVEDFTLDNYSIYLYGDYIVSMNLKYGYSLASWDYKDYAYDFSIVIPVRNEGKYLEYAIKSCLCQEYKGEYEVLISDNSDDNNYDAFNCVKKFDDKRIRYIKTPTVLPLNRSFEFAFFNAKGKYIISIGSDDSVLKYTLKVLDNIIMKDDIDIVSWGNARYEWSSKSNRNKANLMTRHAAFTKKTLKSSDLLEKYYKNSLDFGYLPKLYLGTCFSKRLINIYLSKTGKFEDGYSQDIYTGIKTALLVDNILRLGIPLTVSGVSGNSSGSRSVKSLNNAKDISRKLKEKAVLYESNTFYCINQRIMIDNMTYLKTFSLFEYIEILKANNYEIDNFYVNNFINDSLTINIKEYCDLDFIVSGLLKFSKFYNGNLSDNIHFVKKENLKSKIVRLLPQSFFFYYHNKYKRIVDNYNITYFYDTKIKSGTILDGNSIIEDYFKNEIEELTHE